VGFYLLGVAIGTASAHAEVNIFTANMMTPRLP